MPMFLLKIPTRHIMPKHKFKPPYNPAISEYPNGDVIERPTAFKKLGYPSSRAPSKGSNIAQTPIKAYINAINNKYNLIIQINFFSPTF